MSQISEYFMINETECVLTHEKCIWIKDNEDPDCGICRVAEDFING